MASLPSNNTDRFFLDYTVGTHPHVIDMRASAGALPADASDAFDGLLTILAPTLKHISVTGMRFQAFGSSVTTPVPYTGGTSFGTGDASDTQAASYLSFVGRSPGGHRVRVTVFGAPVPADDNNFRVPVADSTLVADAVTFLEGETAFFRTIDDDHPIWKQYANTGQNAHFRNKYR